MWKGSEAVQSLLDPGILRSLTDQREMELRRVRLAVVLPHPEHRVVRRWIGRQLIRFGEHVAGDRSLSPLGSP